MRVCVSGGHHESRGRRRWRTGSGRRICWCCPWRRGGRPGWSRPQCCNWRKCHRLVWHCGRREADPWIHANCSEWRASRGPRRETHSCPGRTSSWVHIDSPHGTSSKITCFQPQMCRSSLQCSRCIQMCLDRMLQVWRSWVSKVKHWRRQSWHLIDITRMRALQQGRLGSPSEEGNESNEAGKPASHPVCAATAADAPQKHEQVGGSAPTQATSASSRAAAGLEGPLRSLGVAGKYLS